MNGENSLPLWARQILIGIGLFLAGAMLAFGYSYRPLHGALSWQVDQLESRLDERNRENQQLTDSLANQQSVEATRIDPETLAQVKRELDQTQRVLAQAEKDLRRAEGKRKDANASAAKWRKRFKELEDRPAPVAAASAPEQSMTDEAKQTTASPIPDSPNTSPSPAAPNDASAPLETGSATGVDASQTASGRGIMPSEIAAQSKAR